MVDIFRPFDEDGDDDFLSSDSDAQGADNPRQPDPIDDLLFDTEKKGNLSGDLSDDDVDILFGNVNIVNNARVNIGIRMTTEDVLNHIRWFRTMRSQSFKTHVKSIMGDSDTENRFTEVARQAIVSEIYSKSTTPGTNNIYNSINTLMNESSEFSSQDGHLVTLTTFSDPEIAPSEAGSNPGEYSYAAFFEKPIQFDSFIKAVNGVPLHQIRYRPFVDEMTDILSVQALLESDKTIMSSVREFADRARVRYAKLRL